MTLEVHFDYEKNYLSGERTHVSSSEHNFDVASIYLKQTAVVQTSRRRKWSHMPFHIEMMPLLVGSINRLRLNQKKFP